MSLTLSSNADGAAGACILDAPRAPVAAVVNPEPIGISHNLATRIGAVADTVSGVIDRPTAVWLAIAVVISSDREGDKGVTTYWSPSWRTASVSRVRCPSAWPLS